MTGYFFQTRIYSFVWNKYRPAMLKLMIDSASSPQHYKFSPHEFRNINPKEKGGYSFTLRLHKGKSVDNIRSSGIAQDLLFILQQSKTARDLSENDTFEFSLSKQFVLQITRLEKPKEELLEVESETIAF